MNRDIAYSMTKVDTEKYCYAEAAASGTCRHGTAVNGIHGAVIPQSPWRMHVVLDRGPHGGAAAGGAFDCFGIMPWTVIGPLLCAKHNMQFAWQSQIGTPAPHPAHPSPHTHTLIGPEVASHPRAGRSCPSPKPFHAYVPSLIGIALHPCTSLPGDLMNGFSHRDML